MSNRFFNPDEQFADSTGAALSGAQLFFYATGSSAKQNTYSDSGLTVANPNPVVLDSSGRAGSIFLQNLKYKIVLAPATDSDPPVAPIWTMDPVFTSDVSTVAQVQGVNGNPNSQLAGTQGSSSVPASMAWDFTNNILYVCTATGTSVTAVWTAVNPAGSAGAIPAPAGRLTLVSGTPVMSTDQTGATSVLYTPYIDNICPIYNGTTFVATTFAELTLTLASQHVADTLYDVFMFSNSGVATLVTGPAWTTTTAGSSARGTGASTTQLSRINGHLVNTVQITGRNGASTFTIAANQATYLGTIYTDHTAGQVTCHFSYGQNRKFGVWNAYNRVPVVLQVGDSTASWTYSTLTARASNNVPASYSSGVTNVGSGTTANGMAVLTGLAEEAVTVTFTQLLGSNGTGGGANIAPTIGIGLNSITTFSGTQAESTMASNGTLLFSVTAGFVNSPALGLNNIMAMEIEGLSSNAGLWKGTQANMQMQATYRG